MKSMLCIQACRLFLKGQKRDVEACSDPCSGALMHAQTHTHLLMHGGICEDAQCKAFACCLLRDLKRVIQAYSRMCSCPSAPAHTRTHAHTRAHTQTHISSAKRCLGLFCACCLYHSLIQMTCLRLYLPHQNFSVPLHHIGIFEASFILFACLFLSSS